MNRQNKERNALILLGVIVVVLLCVPSSYIVAAIVGGVGVVVGLPAAAKYFNTNKDNDANP